MIYHDSQLIQTCGSPFFVGTSEIMKLHETLSCLVLFALCHEEHSCFFQGFKDGFRCAGRSSGTCRSQEQSRIDIH